jgi:hypothetical protein
MSTHKTGGSPDAGFLRAITLSTAPITLIASAFVVVGLAWPGNLLSSQMYESLRLAAEQRAFGYWAFLATAVVLLSEVLRHSGFALWLQTPGRSGYEKVHVAAVHALATVPYVSTAIACFECSAFQVHHSSERFLEAFGTSTLLTAALVLVLQIRYRRHAGASAKGRAFLCIVAASTFGGVLVGSTSAVQRAPSIGLVAILLFAIAGWTAVGTLLVIAGRALKVPSFQFVLVLALLFSVLDLNDNHFVRIIGSSDDKLPTDYSITGDLLPVLQRWLRTRPDRETYAGSSYPVVLVSSEGGGLRAAYFTAMVLSTIQDRCPGFAEHIFAIGSVSGGSLGAGAYAGLIRQSQHYRANKLPCEPGTDRSVFRDQARKFLRRDFLSPIAAAFAFPDLAQRFLPFPVRSFDRTLALEDAFERGWRQTTSADAFGESFYDLWPGRFDNKPDRGVPALVIGTTWVETGERVVITPLEFGSLGPQRLSVGLRLSTAIVLGARFPYVTPPGSVDYLGSGLATLHKMTSQWEKARLVDGGYYDNSGASLIASLITNVGLDEEGVRELAATSQLDEQRNAPAKLLPYHFIVLTISTLNEEEAFPSSGLGEVLAPLQAALETGNARARDSIRELELAAFQHGGVMVGDELKFYLCPNDESPTPTGWVLSGRAFDWMDAQATGDSCSKHVLAEDVFADTHSNRETFETLVKRLNSLTAMPKR